MKTIRLNGEYRLLYTDEQENPEGFDGARSVMAVVPGNVEIDLARSGELPDIFFGKNVQLLKPYEFYKWRYERSFDAPAPLRGERAFLRFEGVDCVASYFLNGEMFAKSENALVEHRFDVTGLLRQGSNDLAVELRSPMLRAAEYQLDADCDAMTTNKESLRIRKAPSCYGWDIMPRTLSAGLWRGVSLEIEGENEITQLYLAAASISEDGREARIVCVFGAKTNAPRFEGLSLRLTGTLNGGTASDTFSYERRLYFTRDRMEFTIDNPKLWYPNGYGDANVYTVKAEMLLHGEALCEKTTTLGVRVVELNRADIIDATGGSFQFIINGQPVFCKGSNWVPADAMHSRDASRYADMLELWTDTGSNILRCWGGSVYEDHAFYEECDRRGIMVWQDFSMACGHYPRDEAFQAVLRDEAEKVTRKLREHPSIILWSGDNECDGGPDPDANVLTRQVLPDVLRRLDPFRPYLPSSPYMSTAVARLAREKGVSPEVLMPETHLWGPRDYFKSSFYTRANGYFTSETGYHGCNSIRSIKSFISPDKLWPWRDNDEWAVHAAEMDGLGGPYSHRIKLMADQIHELFGIDPDNLEDFALASQISQAEAKKFFIELPRVKKWRRTGVIWWNMIDGWPQFSDAVVSYDFVKKLAYYYIKRSQRPLCLMISEPQDWHVRLVAGNDTLRPREGSCRVWDADTNETLYMGNFSAKANESTRVARIRVSHGEHRLFLIEWESDGVKGYNHYVLGSPPWSFERYKGWLGKIAALDGSFDAQGVWR
ncbi:MAG: hypothetical protein LBS11_10000 [Oscillospiraceae bacterium]|jgi:beta-mannosidase|nr:hypothetical protein [Oscillospiraceae bacterium]